jgi:hypothetical protein
LIKVDNTGDITWNITFSGEREEYPQTLVSTDDGGFLLYGTSYSFEEDNGDIWLRKTDEFGELLWSTSYGDHRYEEARDLYKASDGSLLSLSTIRWGDVGNRDIWLVKVNSDGNKLWDKTYGNKYRDSATKIIQKNDGGYIIAGKTQPEGGYSYIWLFTTNPNGEVQNDLVYRGSISDVIRDIMQTDNGNIVFVGSTHTSQGEQTDILLVKIKIIPYVELVYLSNFETISIYLNHTPEAFLLLSPIIFIVYFLYIKRKNSKLGKLEVNLYPNS